MVTLIGQNSVKRGRYYSSLVFPCALNGKPCTWPQRKHVQKHTTIPFHEAGVFRMTIRERRSRGRRIDQGLPYFWSDAERFSQLSGRAAR